MHLPLPLKSLNQIGIGDGSVEFDGTAGYGGARENGLTFAPGELEDLVAHGDVELAVMGSRAFARAGHGGVGFEPGHVRPRCRHQKEHDEAQQKVDEGDEGEFVIGRPLRAAACDVETSH